MQRVRVACVVFSSLYVSHPATASDQPAERPVAIVIGFVGGRVARDNAVHAEVQLANRLRSEYASRLQVKMFENRRGGDARREILQLLDANGDGQLSKAEKLDARIAIYGHSWGASETVALARALGQQGIPVLLTVQVDSVAKPGEDDGLIPANVARAVNFYQLDGLLHGRAEIRADDSSRTRILGNFRLDYKQRSVDLTGFPWFARMFMKPHIEIESDPTVWQRVESLIRSEFRPAGEDR
jgi:pimeloyl-ACP methyl ester carboxylesterase